MLLKRFTQEGLEAFNEFLSDLNVNNCATKPADLLSSIEFSVQLPERKEIHPRRFITRYELAEYLVEEVGIDSIPDLEHDSLLWSWLANLFFDWLCPASPSGERIPRQRARLVYSSEGKFLFRHLVAGPVFVYLAHRDNPSRVIPLLSDPVHQTGKLYIEITDRHNLLRSPGVVEAAGRLYFDSEKQAIRPGVRSKAPGKIIRFATVLFQFDATWDLQSLSSEQVIELLPTEFDQYKDLAKNEQPASMFK